MNDPTQKIPVLALKRLLVELNEHRPDICFRYRLIGQMWVNHFLRVVKVTGNGILLNDDSSNTITTIADLSHVMQFEIDKPFQIYQPYFHYDVVTTGEW